MSKSAQEVYNEIMDYINNTGVNYNNWYVGIAANSEARLFSDHNVSKNNGQWVYIEALDEDTARKVEKFIITTHKTKGGSGGGDASTINVYAYVITDSTRE